MTRIAIFILAAVQLSCPCLSQKCDLGMTGGAKPAIDVLSKLDPNESNADSRQCMDAAISMLSQLRSKEAIPELIRYLPFKQERQPEPEGESDIGNHRHIADSAYPAVVALARIGPEARAALLAVIESEDSSITITQNAAHAIALSFAYEQDRNPGKSILFIRNEEKSTGSRTKERLEQAVRFILTTPACNRFAVQCQEADHKSAAR